MKFCNKTITPPPFTGSINCTELLLSTIIDSDQSDLIVVLHCSKF